MMCENKKAIGALTALSSSRYLNGNKSPVQNHFLTGITDDFVWYEKRASGVRQTFDKATEVGIGSEVHRQQTAHVQFRKKNNSCEFCAARIRPAFTSYLCWLT